MNSIPKSGRIVYALATPVVMTDAARPKPVNLLARVQRGVREIGVGAERTSRG